MERNGYFWIICLRLLQLSPCWQRKNLLGVLNGHLNLDTREHGDLGL